MMAIIKNLVNVAKFKLFFFISDFFFTLNYSKLLFPFSTLIVLFLPFSFQVNSLKKGDDLYIHFIIIGIIYNNELLKE